MKISPFFIAILFISNTVIAQDIPKRANSIVITDALSQEQYYNNITDILFESGYGIFNTDKAQGTITTSEKSFKHGVIKLTFLVKNERVLIRGQFNMNLSIDYGGVKSDMSWSVIQNFGMRNSPNMYAWNEMNNIANQIPGKKEYLIK